MALPKGVYRHPATGFICHEVYHIDELIASNGIMISVGGWWQWMAGRDFHDFINQARSAGVTTLAQLAGAVYDIAIYPMMIGTAGDVVYERPLALRVGAPKGDATNVRLFGLINNLDCGFGQSGRTGLSSDNNGRGMGHAAGNASFYWGAPGKGLEAMPALYNGAGAIRAPMKMTYTQLLAGFESGIPDSSKSEVQERLLAARTRVFALLAARGVLPTDTVPLIIPFFIRRNGRIAYVPPKRDQMLTDVVGASNMSNVNVGNYTKNYKGVRSLGCRAYTPDGRGVCVQPAVAVASSRGAYHLGDNLSSRGGDYSTAFLAMGSTYIEDTCPLVDLIDGIRYERLFGGLVGNRLDETGERDPVDNVNLSTNSVWNDYWAEVSVELGALPAKTGVGAARETDAAFGARLESNYGSTARNTMRELTLTNYDSYGMTAGNVLALWTLALDSSKAKFLEGMPFLIGSAIPTGHPSVVTVDAPDVYEGLTIATRAGTVYDNPLFAS